MRAIINSNYLAHSAPIFSDLKILDIFKINVLQTAKFMFSYYHQNLPSVFSNLLPVIKSMGTILEMPIVSVPTLAGPISNVLPIYFKALKSGTHCRRP